ncbi:hypothetical protein N7501_003985 [Penicillium viridicatum]|nr:hypothetical protein N7501_003985 [Penicillium viridicatum]
MAGVGGAIDMTEDSVALGDVVVGTKVVPCNHAGTKGFLKIVASEGLYVEYNKVKVQLVIKVNVVGALTLEHLDFRRASKV